jgi:hypothetical protein
VIRPEEQERIDREAEIRRRYDREALLGAHGDMGARMAAVVSRAESLDRDRCEALVAAYDRVVAEADRDGVREELEEAYRYSAPHPLHPQNLYAIDALARNALNYAGLVARERAAGHGLGSIVPVERAAVGVILALAMEVAGRRGAYAPVGPELTALLRRPWEDVIGRPGDGHDGPAGPSRVPGPGAGPGPSDTAPR